MTPARGGGRAPRMVLGKLIEDTPNAFAERYREHAAALERIAADVAASAGEVHWRHEAWCRIWDQIHYYRAEARTLEPT